VQHHAEKTSDKGKANCPRKEAVLPKDKSPQDSLFSCWLSSPSIPCRKMPPPWIWFVTNNHGSCLTLSLKKHEAHRGTKGPDAQGGSLEAKSQRRMPQGSPALATGKESRSPAPGEA